MNQRCNNCGTRWTGCPNCKNPTPDQEMEYSPQDSILSKLAKPAMKMSLNNNPIEDNNPKYNK